VNETSSCFVLSRQLPPIPVTIFLQLQVFDLPRRLALPDRLSSGKKLVIRFHLKAEIC
jgi:hypothetical protein